MPRDSRRADSGCEVCVVSSSDEEPEQRATGARRVVLVGIAGPSGVGKSTLAKALASALDCPFAPICLDSFLKLKGARSCEVPEIVDYAALRARLRGLRELLATSARVPERVAFEELKGANPVRAGQAGKMLAEGDVYAVVEGFLLFWDKELCGLLDARIWLEADLETCMSRRRKRNKNRRAGTTANFERWFRDDVWSHYQSYQKLQLTQAGQVLGLQGTASPDDLLSRSIAFCRKGAQRAVPANDAPVDGNRNPPKASGAPAAKRAPRALRDAAVKTNVSTQNPTAGAPVVTQAEGVSSPRKPLQQEASTPSAAAARTLTGADAALEAENVPAPKKRPRKALGSRPADESAVPTPFSTPQCEDVPAPKKRPRKAPAPAPAEPSECRGSAVTGSEAVLATDVLETPDE